MPIVLFQGVELSSHDVVSAPTAPLRKPLLIAGRAETESVLLLKRLSGYGDAAVLTQKAIPGTIKIYLKSLSEKF